MSTQSEIKRAIRQWIQEHYGLITRFEARNLGASDAFIRHMVASGEWVPVHHGVFRDVRIPRTYYQDVRAAVLATRGVGQVSHQSAAWLLRLWNNEPDAVALSIPRTTGRGLRLHGVTIHRSSDLHLSKSTMVRGLPATNALRTIVDLSNELAPKDLGPIVDTALRTRMVTVAGLHAELDRLGRHGRPGVGQLRRHLTDRGFVGEPAASALEARMRRLINAAGVPTPRVELHAGQGGEYRLDFAWVEIRFAVEVDGYVWHSSPEQVQHDIQRRNALQDQGWTLRIYTWHDVTQEPARVIHEIHANYFRLAGATA